MKTIFRLITLAIIISCSSPAFCQIGKALSNTQQSTSQHSILANDLTALLTSTSSAQKKLSSLGWRLSSIENEDKIVTFSLDETYDNRAPCWIYLYYNDDNIVEFVRYQISNNRLLSTFEPSISSAGFRQVDHERYQSSTLFDGTEFIESSSWDIDKAYKNQNYLLFHNYNDDVHYYYTTKIGSHYDKYSGSRVQYFSDGKYAKYKYVDGKISGKLTIYSESGQVIQELNCLNNKLHGPAKYYTDEEQVEKEGRYKEGKRDGLWHFYFKDENGEWETNRYDMTFSNGEANGPSKFFTEDGRIRAQGNWKNNKQDGLWHNYFSINDDGEWEPDRFDETYSNGEKNGPATYFTEDSSIWREGNWENGKKNGLWHYYFSINDDGKWVPDRADITYSNGEKNGPATYFTEFYDNRRDRVEGQWKNDKKDGQWHRYLFNPHVGEWSVFCYETWSRDEKNGPAKYYDGEGKVWSEGNWKNGKRDGLWHFYDNLENSDITYSYDEKNGPAKYYTGDGKVLREGNWKNDKRDGLWRYYSEDGKGKNETTWKNGLRDGVTRETTDSMTYKRMWKDDKLHGTSWVKDNDQNLIYQFEYHNGKVVSIIDNHTTPTKVVSYNRKTPTSSVITVMAKGSDSTVMIDCQFDQWISYTENFKQFKDDFDSIDGYFNKWKFYLGKMWVSHPPYACGDISILNTKNDSLLCNGKLYRDSKIGKWSFYFHEQGIQMDVMYYNDKDTCERYYDLQGNPYSGKFEYYNNQANVKEVRKIKDGVCITKRTQYYDVTTGKRLRIEGVEVNYMPVKPGADGLKELLGIN